MTAALIMKLGAVTCWTLVVFGTGIFVERYGARRRRRPQRLELPKPRGWR